MLCTQQVFTSTSPACVHTCHLEDLLREGSKEGAQENLPEFRGEVGGSDILG